MNSRFAVQWEAVHPFGKLAIGLSKAFAPPFYLALCLLLCFFFLPKVAFAENSIFTIHVTDQNNANLTGVSIEGNGDLFYLAGKTTGSDGRWSLDLRDVDGLHGLPVTLYFSHPGYKFDQPQIEVNIANCPGYICQVRAEASVEETAVIHMLLSNGMGGAWSGVPLYLSDTDLSCPKKI